MDIVERLNLFLDRIGVSKSQFADSCGIPRPTASQILSGRNKKISDEIIAKIHSIYPQLSIMWLMFGEGTMFVEGSEPNLSKAHENSIFDSNIDSSAGFANVSEEEEPDVPSHVSGNNGVFVKQPFEKKSFQSKQITKIVVFYSDNSFEEFFK